MSSPRQRDRSFLRPAIRLPNELFAAARRSTWRTISGVPPIVSGLSPMLLGLGRTAPPAAGRMFVTTEMPHDENLQVTRCSSVSKLSTPAECP
jgi:hypothetical protein